MQHTQLTATGSRKLAVWQVIITTLCAIAMLSACDKQQPPAAQRPAPQVNYVTVQPTAIQLTTELPGRCAPFRVAEIRPQVSGLIQQRLFSEGSDVTAGQVLYQIDPAQFIAALHNAQAALGRATANLPALQSKVERFQKMVAINAVSQQDYDDAHAALTQLEADIQYYRAAEQTALINLSYTKITAPISGRIGTSNVTDGAIVTAYQPLPLATIQQLDPIYVDIPQSTTDLLLLKQRLNDGRLQLGAEQNQVILQLSEGSTYPQHGEIQFSDITVDPSTASVTLRSLFANPSGTLLPGMFVQALINEGIKPDAILVPQQGVARDPKGNPYALVVDDKSTATFRPLQLDRAIGDKWLVASGLETGDKVIVTGLMMLRPGTVVNATEFQPDTANQANQSAPKSN